MTLNEYSNAGKIRAAIDELSFDASTKEIQAWVGEQRNAFHGKEFRVSLLPIEYIAKVRADYIRRITAMDDEEIDALFGDNV